MGEVNEEFIAEVFATSSYLLIVDGLSVFCFPRNFLFPVCQMFSAKNVQNIHSYTQLSNFS